SDGAKINPKSRNDKVWRWSQESYLSQKHRLSFNKSKNSPLLDENGNSSNWNVYTKQYLHEIQEKGYVPSNLIDENTNSIGSKELKELGVDFDFPKPSTLIGYLARIIDFNSSDILLDFFSGSATTAHAVMQLNAEDGGNRKYICVQLPEPCDENSEAYKAGYKNICEIGKERIRRAGEKIVAQLKEKQNGQQQLLESEGAIVNPDTLDIGFKVFRVAYSNIRWTHDAINNTGLTPIEEIQFSQKDLLDFMIHFTDIDVVYEILLRQRDIPLSSKVEQISKIGNRTYMFADSYVVCLEEQITKELIEALAAIEPLPIKYVFRDSAFEDDISLKDETFRRLQALISRNTGESKKTYTVEFI
ncbi:MAG TPA: site-specific DNA-methyltransferase, partial [Candidatus Margulisbacteria bacterium]|nr:site-specific DNA-methyltransferase [Candidatus Margulisiibacteriota bacterium]